jgi:hypothetical protein
MSREKLLTVSVVLLLLLNFGILGFLLLGHKPPPPPDGPGRPPHPGLPVVEKLHFDESQKTAFDQMKKEHHATMEKLDEQHEGILKQYFEMLGKSGNIQSQKDSLEHALASVEARRASVTFEHFNAVKAMCRPDQVSQFDDLIPDILQLLLKPRGPQQGPPPPHRGR